MTAAKQDRQSAIREIIGSRAVASQEELRQLLAERGWEVTQSTLSRDMRDLRIARIPTAAGTRYTTADGGGHDEGRATLASIFPQFFSRLDSVREFLVVRTKIAGAQPIAEAIDAEDSPDILGTIAGENTILIICRSDAARDRVAKRLLSLARR
ncbi:MAG: ArgR family transcriptional regulator [Gemmatimonadetes bacterium]|nr:ArgR family transcriptional regulator [Gemmatimonadota bacterium]